MRDQSNFTFDICILRLIQNKKYNQTFTFILVLRW